MIPANYYEAHKNIGLFFNRIANCFCPKETFLHSGSGYCAYDVAGGILSHCAVVAREYRIPAVVGTGAATKLISDGQVLEVDGDNGIVRIVG